MCVHMCVCTHIYVRTACLCVYILYMDVCAYVYAGIPMGRKSSVNYPWGGISSRETQSPPAGAQFRASPTPLRKHFWGLRQSPGPRLDLPAAAGGRRKTPSRALLPPACSCRVFLRGHRHRWVPDTQAQPSDGSTPSSEGRGRERKGTKAFFPAFLCLCLGKTSGAKS